MELLATRLRRLLFSASTDDSLAYNGSMSPPDEHPTPSPRGVRRFATTRWSMVLAAGRPVSPDSKQALADLCETYWYPLYAYIRHRGYRAHNLPWAHWAQDLTQEFFAQLLEKDSLQAADPRRGKFRSFLPASLSSSLYIPEGIREFEVVGGDSVGDRATLRSQSPTESPPTRGFSPVEFPDTLAYLRATTRTPPDRRSAAH